MIIYSYATNKIIKWYKIQKIKKYNKRMIQLINNINYS